MKLGCILCQPDTVKKRICGSGWNENHLIMNFAREAMRWIPIWNETTHSLSTPEEHTTPINTVHSPNSILYTRRFSFLTDKVIFYVESSVDKRIANKPSLANAKVIAFISLSLKIKQIISWIHVFWGRNDKIVWFIDWSLLRYFVCARKALKEQA